jgi:hypothetical protein
MFTRMERLGAFMLAITLLISGCKGKGEATPNPQAVFTAAAETASARMTEMAAVTPVPTDTPTQPPTETPTITATSAPPTATLPPAAAGTVMDRVEFVADVTVPDNTVFAPNQSFKKTWRLKNAGYTTWTSAYSLIFFSGEKMNSPTAIPLPGDVPPNGTVDLTVDLVSPATPGQYIGYYMLRNPQGKNFGLGPNADQAFYVWINVAANGTVVASVTPTGPTATLGTPGTPSPTVAPTSSSVITNPAISVDNASFTGTCPHTFVFPIQFTVSQATSVTYKLEAGSGTPGVSLTLPDPLTQNVNPGNYTNSFQLTINSSMSGWAKLHITAPVDISSNVVNFALTCQ